MARNNETTTKFKVDISELKQAMTEARKQVAYANSEFKAVSSSLDDWSKSSDGLKAKLKQLNSNLESQEKVLNEYEGELERIKKEYGENSKEALEYGKILNEQRATVNYIKKDISKYEDALKEVSEAEKIASKTGKDVAEVLADVGDEAEDAGDGFTVFKGAIATFVGNGLTNLVGGLRDATSSILGLAESTREYRDQMAKLSSASSEAGYTSTYTANKYKELYGVLADDTATTTTLSNFMALEASGKTLDSFLNSSIGIWSKFGDSIPLDGLAEAINHTSKLGSVQGNLADALEWSGINVDDFNAQLEKCNSEQERQQLIASTLDSLYGDLASTYKENNKSIIEANEAQAEYNDVMGDLGAMAEPITTTLKTGFTDVLKEALKLFGGEVDIESFTSTLESGFTVLTGTVLPAVKTGLEGVKTAFKWLLDNKDAIIAGLVGIGTGFLAFNVATTIMTVTTALKGFTSGLTLAQVAMKLFNTVVGANPILKLVTILIAVVTAIATFIATNDEARAKFLEIWGKIVDGFKDVIDKIKVFCTETIPKFFKSLLDWVQENWQALLLFLINPFAGLFKYFYDNNKKFREFVDNAINEIKQLPTKVWTWLQNTIAKVTTWFIQMSNKAKETGSNFLSKLMEFITQLPSKIWTQISNAYSQVSTWATNMINKARETGSNFLNNVINFISQLPSRVWDFLSNTLSNVSSFVSNMASRAGEAGRGFYNNLVSAISGLPSKMWSIGSDIVSGIWNGISSGWGWLKDKVGSLASSLYEKAKNVLGIHSPSKVFADEVGKWIPAGIAVGVKNNAKSALNAVKDLAVDTVGNARAGLGDVTTSVGGNGSVVNNFTQVINSPKQLSRLEIYRQSKNLLGFAGGGV